MGIIRSGEDVVVPAAIAVPLANISVYNPITDAIGAPPPAETFVSPTFSQWAAGDSNQARAGVFVLRPIRYSISGQRDDTGGIVEITDELLTSPDRDPDDYAYEDWQTIDGCRLIFFPWPIDVIPLPASDALTRNHLANAIFTVEGAFGRDDAFPWELAGLPLAIVSFDAAWKPIFVDRSSVVRVGGFPRLAFDTTLDNVWRAANPFLAEARIRQFLEQTLDTFASPPVLLSASYQYLPPVGILTPASIDLAGVPTFKNHVFPSNYAITAKPVLADELDAIVSSSAELAPYDLTAADSVEILVPIADADYDKDLLTQATPDPIFQQQIGQNETDRLNALKHRLDLRKKANALLQPLGQPAVDVNADVTADEQKDLTGNPAYTPPADESNFGTALQADGSTASADYVTLTTAVKADAALFNAKDAANLAKDIPTFIQDLHQRIAGANDLLDLAFLRSQTDIYRYRQNMLDNVTATRLATSPALAQIAQGISAPATTEQIDDYFATAVKQPSPPPAPSQPPPPYKQPAPPPRGIVPSTLGKMAPITLAAKTGGIKALPAAVQSRSLATALRPAAITIPSGVSTGIRIPVATATLPTITAAGSGTVAITTRAVPTSAAPAIATAVPVSVEAVAQKAALAAKVVSPTQLVQEQSPLVGAQYIRTSSVVERLAQSPSQEAMFFTGQNRVEVTTSILGLPLQLDDLPITVNGAAKTLADIRKDNTGLATPPVPGDPDEASVLSAGIGALEEHILLLRQLEGRVAQYNAFVTQAQQAISAIQANLSTLDATLKNVEDTLADARSAYIFSTALLADETARDKSINARRAAVLNAVPFVVYRRPRAVSAFVAEPTCPLLPEASTVVPPACLNSTVPVPPELRQLTALLQHAPLDWFPALFDSLNAFERPDLMLSLAQEMQFSAIQTQSLNRSTSITLDASVYADKIDFAFTSQSSKLELYRQSRAAFSVASIQTATLSSQRGALRNVVTLGDLIRSSYGNLIGGRISRAIDQITSVAGCLYRDCGQVAPVIRLAWADFLYQPTDNADLSDLAILPSWGNVPLDSRYQMQALVSWLFSQINDNVADAVGFMSDVVRVSILLASYAPVSEIINGTSLEQAPLRIGLPIRVSLPSARIFANMPVEIYNANAAVIAHGVVTDLSTTDAAVHVTSIVDAAATTLPAGSMVQFVANKTWSNSVSAAGLPLPKAEAR
jgi:hypothetical protein